MSEKLVACPNCRRIFHIKRHTEITCICGNTYAVERERGNITLNEIKTIKTKPFKARKI